MNMQKADAKSFSSFAAETLSELSLSVGITVCLSNQMSFFLQNNQLAMQVEVEVKSSDMCA